MTSFRSTWSSVVTNEAPAVRATVARFGGLALLFTQRFLPRTNVRWTSVALVSRCLAVFTGIGACSVPGWVFWRLASAECLSFPFLNLVIRERQRRKVIARNLVQLTFPRHRSVDVRVRRVSVRSQRISSDSTARDCSILANHPTLIDIVFLMAFVPQADCIVKAQSLAQSFHPRDRSCCRLYCQ